MTVYNKYETWYHILVAPRKKAASNKKPSQGAQAIVIFWLIFVIVIISVFMANSNTIKENFNLFKTRLTAGTEDDLLMDDEEETAEEPSEPEFRIVVEPAPERTTTQPAVTQQPSSNQTEQRTQTTEPARPAEQTRPQTTQTTQTPAAPAVQTRDRPVYFTQIDRDGKIFQSRIIRRVPVSETPMQDVLNIMLAGPSADELNRGILNIIPQNTRLLRAEVRGSTAYLSFSEDFMFNTFGVEGYIAQLKQIVWTVTEFQNLNDVQILIEGRVLNYLGEGIWIGSPISRQSF
jgi:spore germination protein GerM